MRRQNSSVSSLRRSNSTEVILGRSTGCMSGVVTFVSKYLSHRRKRISFGSSAKSQASKEDDSFRTLSPDHSQTIPIIHVRHSSSPGSTPTVVARLMGLEKPPAEVDSPETEEQKRRNLLGALEECDKELKAVKKILTTVCSGESLRSPALAMDKRVCSEDKKAGITCRSSSYSNDIKFSGSMQAHGKKQGVEEQFKLSILEKLKELSQPVIVAGQEAELRKAGNEDVESAARKRGSSAKKKLGMKESVKEVCRDIAWGEKREIGRIGLSLQHQICRDLIGEIIADMGLKKCLHSYSLPFHSACRRRLRF